MEDHLVQHIGKHREQLLRMHRSVAGALSRNPERKSHVDYVVGGALRRSYALTIAFFDLIEKGNYTVAAPLTRMQLDNTLRTTAAFVFESTSKFLEHIAAGGRIDQLKDANGQRLTDRSLVERLAPDFPWVRTLYDDGSRFVHLSEIHMFHNNEATIELSERDESFGDLAYFELVESFVVATRLFFGYVSRWVSVKQTLRTLPEGTRFVGFRLRSSSDESLRLRVTPRLRMLLNVAPRPSKRARARMLRSRRWRVADRPTRENVESLQPWLIRILERHKLLTCRLFNEWIVVDGRFPAIRSKLFPPRVRNNEVSIQLDVEVLLGDTIIREAFAGFGETQATAAADAMDNFCANSLHVFLAAIWNRIEPEHIRIESWEIGGTVWHVFIGNTGIRSADLAAVNIPKRFPDIAHDVLRRQPLDGSIHWFRFFCARVDNRLVATEALLDNKPWRQAVKALRSLEWKPSSGYSSLRSFAILLNPGKPQHAETA